ncbi:unnamed protein product [Lampetra planeri]
MGTSGGPQRGKGLDGAAAASRIWDNRVVAVPHETLTKHELRAPVPSEIFHVSSSCAHRVRCRGTLAQGWGAYGPGPHLARDFASSGPLPHEANVTASISAALIERWRENVWT